MVVAGLWTVWAGWWRLSGRGLPRAPKVVGYASVVLGVALIASAAFVPKAMFTPAAPASVRPHSTATIAIVRPVENQEITGNVMTVVLALHGGEIVPTGTTTLAPDTGHVHLSIDGRLVSMTYGLRQDVDLSSFASGTHSLTAEFVAADHAPFSPPVTATVTFQKA